MIQMLFGDWVSIVCNGVTLLLFLYVLIRFLSIRRAIRENSDEVRNIQSGRQMRREIGDDATMRVISGSVFDPKEINELKKNYDGICADFETVSQLIPVFPSLGILGTVAGLMMQLESEGIEQMTDSIALALGTTLAALIAAVILKFIGATLSGSLNRLEVEYRGYDRERQVLVDRQFLREGKDGEKV